MKNNTLLFFALSTFCPNLLIGQTSLQGTLLTKYQVNQKVANSFDTIRFSNQLVELYDINTKKRFKAYTNSEGKFFFEGIQKGDYHLSIYDPVIKSRKSVAVRVQNDGKKNTMKPIVIDRTNQTLRIKRE